MHDLAQAAIRNRLYKLIEQLASAILFPSHMKAMYMYVGTKSFQKYTQDLRGLLIQTHIGTVQMIPIKQAGVQRKVT